MQHRSKLPWALQGCAPGKGARRRACVRGRGLWRLLLALLLGALPLILCGVYAHASELSPAVEAQSSLSADQDQCTWQPRRQGDPTIYYINMDSSGGRRREMHRLLSRTGARFERVRGLTMNNIHVPEDLQVRPLCARCASPSPLASLPPSLSLAPS